MQERVEWGYENMALRFHTYIYTDVTFFPAILIFHGGTARQQSLGIQGGGSQ